MKHAINLFQCSRSTSLFPTFPLLASACNNITSELVESSDYKSSFRESPAMLKVILQTVQLQNKSDIAME